MATPTLSIVNGQVGLFSSRQQLAAAGVYYVATNATPGTALNTGQISTYSATADGFLTIVNNNPTGSGVNIYPDYLKCMMSGTAAAGTTVMNFNLVTDAVAGVTPTAGNVALSAINVNRGSTNSSNSIINVSTGAAAMTIPAATGAAKNIGRAQIPTSLGITGDVYVLDFGGQQVDIGGQGGGTAVRATAPARLSDCTVPVIIPPQTGLIVNMWWLGSITNKPFFEYEIGLVEV
jgi:hypothetical protein